MVSLCSNLSSRMLLRLSSTLKAPRSYHNLHWHRDIPSNSLNTKTNRFTQTLTTRPFSVNSIMEQNGLVSFQFSPSSLIKIQKGDITRWSVDGSSDAIVNPANELMLGGGGADGAIHRAAGPELREACYKVREVRPGVRCPTGEARITRGFKLPASHVIHTVGPIYDEDRNPEVSLRNAYKNSLRVAKENNIRYIAFPAISCGVYRYPFDEAANVALSTVKEFGNDLKESVSRGWWRSRWFCWGHSYRESLHVHQTEVHFVLFSDEIYDAWLKKAKDIFSD